MPLYDFKCSSCEHSFEKTLKIVDRATPIEQSCPSCFKYNTVVSVVSSPRICAGVGDFRARVPDVFKDRLREIKKSSGKGNTIDV